MSTSPSPMLQAMVVLLKTLQDSPFYNEYIVRGSFVSRQWMQPYSRECHDLDLIYTGQYDFDFLVSQVEYLLEHSNYNHILFNKKAMQIHRIWEDNIAPGVRFIIPCQLNNVETEPLQLQVDIACNEPMVTTPIEQTINGVLVRTVPLEELAAWKLHGLFEHVHGAWVAKTLWDLYVFCRFNKLDQDLFIKATHNAFSCRLDPLEVITRLLEGDFGHSKHTQKNWIKAFPTMTTAPFMDMQEVIMWVRNYLKPLLGHYCKSELRTHEAVINYRIEQLKTLKQHHPDIVKSKLKDVYHKRKIFPRKAYATINHIPTSRLGTSERCISTGQYELFVNPDTYTPNTVIIVQEKLDGSCVCAYRQNNEIYALGRDGDLADESLTIIRRSWAEWVSNNEERFKAVLQEGERLCGEWLAVAHGTRYELSHEPFVAFDLFTSTNIQVPYQTFSERIAAGSFIKPHVIHQGKPLALEKLLEKLGTQGFHGAVDKPEGLIFRLERNGKLAFIAKYVNPDKKDGCYLPENTGKTEVWNIIK